MTTSNERAMILILHVIWSLSLRGWRSQAKLIKTLKTKERVGGETSSSHQHCVRPIIFFFLLLGFVFLWCSEESFIGYIEKLCLRTHTTGNERKWAWLRGGLMAGRIPPSGLMPRACASLNAHSHTMIMMQQWKREWMRPASCWFVFWSHGHDNTMMMLHSHGKGIILKPVSFSNQIESVLMCDQTKKTRLNWLWWLV